jgi:hypothetical protein
MSTRKRVGPVLAILVIVAASVASKAAPPPPQTSEGKNLRARVKILALDSYGKPFGGFKIIRFKDDKGSDFGGRFAGSIANDIPFGTYWARLQIDSGGWMTRKVVVQRTDCLVIFADNPVTIESAPGKAPLVSGRLTVLPTNFERPVWVKLCDLYLDGCAIAEVDEHNQFSFSNLIPAAFVISVLTVSGDIMTERVDIQRPDSLIILDPQKAGHDRVRVLAAH